MVERAAALAEGANLDNLSFQVGNILDLPFEDNTFDAVYVLRGDRAPERASEGYERAGSRSEEGRYRGHYADGLEPHTCLRRRVPAAESLHRAVRAAASRLAGRLR